MEESAERYGVGLDEIIEQMRSTDDIILFRAIKAANKMLREKNILAATICDRLVNAGIVQILVRILESDNSDWQYEAAAIVAPLAKEMKIEIAENRIIQKLIELLRSNTIKVAERSAHALCFIVGMGDVCCNEVLRNDVVEAIMIVLQKDQPLSFLEKIANFMWHLCHFSSLGSTTPSVHIEKIYKISSAFEKLLSLDYPRILMFALLALITMQYMPSYRNSAAAVIVTGCMPNLIRLLDSTNDDVLLYSLMIVSNHLRYGSQVTPQIDILIEGGALISFQKILKGPNMKTAQFVPILELISLGNLNQIQAVRQSGLIDDIFDLLKNGEHDGKEVAAYLIINIIYSDQSDYMTETVLKPLCDMMNSGYVPTLLNTLESLKCLFESAGKHFHDSDFKEAFLSTIEEIGAAGRLNELQQHENEEVEKLADYIIETYF